MRGATEGIGSVSPGRGLGIEVLIRLHVDALAALGIVERRGVGRVRYLDVVSLRIQEQQLHRVLEMNKVAGLENPADLLTKYLNRERIDACIDLIGYRFETGRAQSTAQLHSCGHVDGGGSPRADQGESSSLFLRSGASPPLSQVGGVLGDASNCSKSSWQARAQNDEQCAVRDADGCTTHGVLKLTLEKSLCFQSGIFAHQNIMSF